MAFADWSEDDYQNFHDDVFDEVFNNLDFAYMSEVDIMAAEEMFEQGWLNMHLSATEKNMWRNAFYNHMNMELNSNEWRIYRELYDQANS
jgi:hypothetical protein